MEQVKIENESLKKEKKESWEIQRGAVNSYLDFFSEEELCNRIIESMDRFDEQEKKFFFKKSGLNVNCSINELKDYLNIKINSYSEYVNSTKELLPNAKKILVDWSLENNIEYNQDIEDIGIFVIDDVLVQRDVKEYLELHFFSAYEPRKNIITLSTSVGNNVLVHEFLHALSHEKSLQRVGFTKFNKDGYLKEESNQWLNEGCTVLMESEILGSNFYRKNGEDPYIEGYLWLTKLFIEEIGIKKEELFKAYFNQDNYMDILENICKTKFNCSILDLKNLLLGFSKDAQERMRKVLKGEDVYLNIYPGFDMNLLNIFPNIKIKENAE